MRAPVDITVLRSGIPDTVPGRSVNLCERGLGAVMAGELVLGEAVGIEVRLPLAQESLRARATVRYQDKLRCGLEFVGLSAEQQAMLRDWVKEAKAEAISEMSGKPSAAMERTAAEKPSPETSGGGKSVRSDGGSGGGSSGGGTGTPKKKSRHWIAWTMVVILLAAAAGGLWWRWNRDWEELEAGLKRDAARTEEKPQAQVPAEVMERLLVHRVEPVYPPEARQARLEGVIALDVVVGRDGSVVSMHPLNGPNVLARAAMDALRWWKFTPYQINGESAVVETTVAVEFKR